MALSQDDLELLGSFIDKRVSALVSDVEKDRADRDAASAVQNRTAVVGKPDQDPEAGPDYYVHLASGGVVVSKDSASTHLPDDVTGEPVAVIGRYQKGA
jgi:hypothetical protein